MNLKNKCIIVVEDVLDKGDTLIFLEKFLKKSSPKRIDFCILLEKEGCKENSPKIQYKVIQEKIPQDKWVFGFGMDNSNLHRGLDTIYYVV